MKNFQSVSWRSLVLIGVSVGSLSLLGTVCSTPLNTNTSNSAGTQAQTLNFSSPNMEYVVAYPAEWFVWSGSEFYPEEFDSKEQDIDYISTADRVTGSDIQGDGVSLAITFRSKRNFATAEPMTFAEVITEDTGINTVTKSENLTIAGFPAVRQFETDPRDPTFEYGYMVGTYVDTPEGVYTFLVSATSAEAYELFAPQVDGVIKSLQLK